MIPFDVMALRECLGEKHIAEPPPEFFTASVKVEMALFLVSAVTSSVEPRILNPWCFCSGFSCSFASLRVIGGSNEKRMNFTPLWRASAASSGSLFGGLTGFVLEGGALGEGASGGAANPLVAQKSVAAMKDFMGTITDINSVLEDREIRQSNKRLALGAVSPETDWSRDVPAARTFPCGAGGG